MESVGTNMLIDASVHAAFSRDLCRDLNVNVITRGA